MEPIEVGVGVRVRVRVWVRVKVKIVHRLGLVIMRTHTQTLTPIGSGWV